MKKNIKNLLLIMMAFLGVLTLTGCKGKYKYPNETPQITNPNEVYLTIGDYKVTKEQVYYRNLSSYGVTVLNDLIDDILLPKFADLTAEEKAAYEDYRNSRIYGTEDIESLDAEEKSEAEKSYKKSQVLQGYYTDEAIETGLKLEYRRYVYASREVKKEIAEFEPITDDEGNVTQEEYFTETEIENAMATVYPDESTIILLTFRSELEAKALMEEVGIYTDVADYRGWHQLVVDDKGNKSAGKLLTQTEVYDAFIKMYNILYGHLGCSIKENAYTLKDGKYVWSLEENANGYNNFRYTYTELSKVSSVIAKKVFESLTTDSLVASYTLAPNKYLTKYFLAIELEEATTEDVELTDTALENQLIENKLTSALVEYYLYENRLANDLVIYDRGLEILYADDYTSIYESLSLEADYSKTDLISNKNIATLTVDGQTVSISADQIYDEMAERYGVTTGIGFISQYIALSNEFNKVFNIVTGEILDQEAYDALYEEEIAPYKEELEAGTFASVGYPKGYGWENFLRDRFGVLNEMELIALGDIYDESLDKFGESQYVFANDESELISSLFSKLLAGEITREDYVLEVAKYAEVAENTIQYQMQKIVDDFYSVSAYSIRVFTDLDHNGTADNLTEEAEVYSKLFIDYLLEEANNTNVSGKTYAERLATLVKQYNLASINDSTVVGTTTYAELKQQGIEVTISTITTYSSKTETNEELGLVLKELWNQVKDGKVADTKFTSTTKSIDFTNELISDFYTTSTAISKVIVTAANDYTYVVNNTTTQQVLPTEELINRYLIVNKEDDEKSDEELELSVTTKEKAAIEAYYKVALDVFMSDDAIADALIAEREALMKVGTIKFTNSADTEKYEILMKNIE